MDLKDLVRHIGEKEPLNPYQAAGILAVLAASQRHFEPNTVLDADNLPAVLMVLDRTGAEAAPLLVNVRCKDHLAILHLKFPREVLEKTQYLTAYKGRRAAIQEHLAPTLYEIPNWLDVVQTLSRYALDRDEEALGEHFDIVNNIVLTFFMSAVKQPFDAQARSQAEYQLGRYLESILKVADEETFKKYLPFLRDGMTFLSDVSFPKPINSFERRLQILLFLNAAMKRRPPESQAMTIPWLHRMYAAALVSALDQITPPDPKLIDELEKAVVQETFQGQEEFKALILEKVMQQGPGEIAKRKNLFHAYLSGEAICDDAAFSEATAFIRNFGAEWTNILASFRERIDGIPPFIQQIFCEMLAAQILQVRQPEVKQLLINGLCDIIVRLEKTRKKASRELVNNLAELFLSKAYSSDSNDITLSALKALESLGVTFGKAGYFLMAQELIDHLVRRPLMQPREKRFNIEDDDTGEPVVVAEDTAVNETHVQHIKSLMTIVASNPRVMHRLIPYLIVQIEIGRTQLCDEDLIQVEISKLLRANSSITHFLIRTLIKAIPYSFKDIGPLEALRLTAAGLAKELANRGVKPIGNFLGKLRGDIHWRGSMDNLFFAMGIVQYLASGDRQYIAEWMPQESLPYLEMTQWCSSEEAAGIKACYAQICADYGIDPLSRDSMNQFLQVDTERYREDDRWPPFARRVALDMIDLVKGLHTKYFIGRESLSDHDETGDLERMEQVLERRIHTKRTFLTPDLKDPLPNVATLTEGSEGWTAELERLRKDPSGPPIILRAKKAGHAYAQRATYLEPRFEAFNEDLADEALQETLATSINNTYFDAITLENLPRALLFLDHLVTGISVNGHSSYYLRQASRDLRQAGELGLTFDKVRDLLKMIKKELDDIHAQYRQWFEPPFDDVLSHCAMENLPRKLRDLTTLKEIPDTDFFKNYLKTLYVSDLQARDGNLRVLETFVEKVELFLSQRLAESGRTVVSGPASHQPLIPFHFPGDGEVSPCKIGQKASLLHFAENTPPFFVITTDQTVKSYEEMAADEEFRRGLANAMDRLGRSWGRFLGDVDNPALFSVRSGARISMPGMMITITNVGINDQIAEVLSQKVGEWFAYDCYRRFLQEFGESVFGIEREEFQEIIDDKKARFNVLRKALMSAAQMKSLAFDYKRRLGELAPRAVEMLDRGNFLDILLHCAVAVLHSYEGNAATKYRQAAGIDGNWRTPAIIQAMVYGNMELNSSGTGVVSYNPFTLDLRGEFAQGDQGTDVVDGKVVTMPVYDPWKTRECLASQLPDAWKELSSILFRTAEKLHLDTRVEYTIEKGKVFILQIRKDRERKERIPSLKEFGYHVIAQGTGVSGKIFRGIMVTDRNQIAPFRHINKAQSIIDAMNETLPELHKLDGFIFVVNDPIPEEIMEEIFSLPVNTALVSRLGGRGAHAADISKSLGKVYVGQVRQIEKFAGKPEVVRFDGLDVIVGTKMVIHGQTGEVALYKPISLKQSESSCDEP
ncbi:MAG: PEP/pyruvate-binding domain-containing protein [Desulfomonilaceae bacterium]